MERRRVVFSGRVQGVGFRATAAGAARGHAVTGWVRNEGDGTVMMEVQGERGSVEAYLDDVREKMGSLIRREQISVMTVEEGEAGFAVER